jgi:glycosyltransferase involved in cell wall biosynthesis
MNIAYFSPLPPQHTGIADYSAELLPHLAKEVELVLFVDDVEAIAPTFKNHFQIYPADVFPHLRWAYDLAIYHMGNSLFHQKIYATLKRYPGLTVLHDYILHHFHTCTTVGEGDFPAYVREMGYAKGQEGIERARAIRQCEASHPMFDWALNERVIDSSIGILVHSDYARNQLLITRPAAKVRKVNQLVTLPSTRNQHTVRAKLNLPQEEFIAVTCGQITPEKRLDTICRSFARFHQDHPDALWLIVGESLEGFADWKEFLKASGLGDNVKCTGYVDELDTFYDYIAAGDVCINLRNPSSGETSNSTLRAMAVGRPIIVSDKGWYAELPDDACIKITHDGTEIEQLAHILTRLYENPKRRLALGEGARDYIAHECDPEHVAREYVSFVHELLDHRSR